MPYGSKNGRFKHGLTLKGKRHPFFSLWKHMRDRCENPKNKNFERYGGRGILVCDQWQNFGTFVKDMGERPPNTSLDRINNDGNYEPSNCRWATDKEQSNNRRPCKDWLRWGMEEFQESWG